MIFGSVSVSVFVYGALFLVALKAMVLGSNFSFYYWLRDRKKYWDWYKDQQTYAEFLKCEKIEEEISRIAEQDRRQLERKGCDKGRKGRFFGI